MATGDFQLTHLGTAMVLLEIGGLRILTDPVLDPAGGVYSFGYGTRSTKLTAPAIEAASLMPIDAVLLSHDQHADNLDSAGRAGREVSSCADDGARSSTARSERDRVGSISNA